MKLGEALTRRKDLETRTTELLHLITDDVTYEEGTTPNSDVSVLMKELDAVLEEHYELVSRINRTNSTTPFNDKSDKTIADAIVVRDMFKKRQGLLQEIIRQSKSRRDRDYNGNVTVYLSQLDTQELRKELDETAKGFRTLDVELQAANWSIDLVD